MMSVLITGMRVVRFRTMPLLSIFTILAVTSHMCLRHTTSTAVQMIVAGAVWGLQSICTVAVCLSPGEGARLTYDSKRITRSSIAVLAYAILCGLAVVIAPVVARHFHWKLAPSESVAGLVSCFAAVALGLSAALAFLCGLNPIMAFGMSAALMLRRPRWMIASLLASLFPLLAVVPLLTVPDWVRQSEAIAILLYAPCVSFASLVRCAVAVGILLASGCAIPRPREQGESLSIDAICRVFMAGVLAATAGLFIGVWLRNWESPMPDFGVAISNLLRFVPRSLSSFSGLLLMGAIIGYLSPAKLKPWKVGSAAGVVCGILMLVGGDYPLRIVIMLPIQVALSFLVYAIVGAVGAVVMRNKRWSQERCATVLPPSALH